MNSRHRVIVMSTEPILDVVTGPPAPTVIAATETTLDAVVDAILDQYPSQLPDERDLWNHYPHYMPALLEHLKRAQLIRQAADRSESVMESHPDLKLDLSTAHDDIDYLQGQFPDYEIQDRLGRGGQACVYAAIQRSTQRPVAIKLLKHGPLASDAERARFQRELTVIARLRHPNIVSVYMGGVAGGQHWFSMERIEEAEALNDYVVLKQPSLREFIQLFEQVVRAIAYAHQQAVIHRDIKPSNVLVDCHGVPRVVDFGLAKILGGEHTGAEISQRGEILGTLPYLSPEQVRLGEGYVDVRTDVYSLGVMFYRLLTGRYPYRVEGTPEEVRKSICEAMPAAIRGTLFAPHVDHHSANVISHDLEKVVFKALEKDKERRYQSALAFADDLASYLRGDAVTARGADRWYQARKALRKHRKAAIISGSFVMLLMASLAVVYSQWRRAEDIAFQYQLGLDAASFTRLGAVARDADRNDDAIAMFEKAIEISKLADRATPVLLAARIDACQRLGAIYYGSKDFARGDHMLAIAQAAMREFEDQGEPLLRLRAQYSVHHLAAEGAWRKRDGPRQLDERLKGQKISDQLLATGPDNPDLIRLQKNSLFNLANAFLEVNKPADARRCIEQTQQLIERLRRFDPTKEELDIDETNCRLKLAKCQFQEKTMNGYRAGLDILNNAQRIHRAWMETGRFKELRRSAETLEKDLQTFKDWANRQILRRQSRNRDLDWPLVFEPL